MAKQLFNSSEKSNFILNLTEEKYAKMASFGMLSALFTTSVATAIPVIAHDSGLYVLSAAGLAVSGVICMIIAIIALMKKYISGKLIFPACAFGAMLVWGVISLINSFDKGISLYGYNGRGEGLLAIAFYGCFFITAASLRRDKAFSTVINGLVGVGILNSVFGLIQIFTGKLSHYRMISIEIQANAASGLSQSPLFLAMTLTFSLTAALIAFVCTKEKAKKLIYIASACLFSFVMMFTYSFIGICGAAFAVIAAVVIVFAAKANKANLLAPLAVIVPAAAAVIIVNAGIIGTLDSYRLYDGRILWFADAYYRVSASGAPDSNKVDIDDTYDVYYTLNRKTSNIISQHKLTGTGPDQLVFPQLYTYGDYVPEDGEVSVESVVIQNSGTFDKVYNEYLYTAATRGVPSLIALIAVLLPVLFIGYKNSKAGDWRRKCIFVLTLGGMLIFFIGCSNTAFAPMFWTLAGCSVAQIAAPEKKEEPEKAE